MGDRVAVRFVQTSEYIDPKTKKKKKYEDCSIAVFAHWGGTEFPKLVEEFYKQNFPMPSESLLMPLDRREPSLMVLNFILWLGQDELKFPVASSYYLGKDHRDGDASDNGVWDFDASTGELVRILIDDWENNRWRIIEGKNIRIYLGRYDENREHSETLPTYEAYKAWLRSLPEYKPSK